MMMNTRHIQRITQHISALLWYKSIYYDIFVRWYMYVYVSANGMDDIGVILYNGGE